MHNPVYVKLYINWAEKIIYLPGVMKLPNEAVCYIIYSAPVKCMALSLTVGSKRYCKK